MSEAGYALQSNRVSLLTRSRGAHRLATASALWAFVLGNAAVLVWLWVHGGNVTNVHSTGELLTSLARITGLLGAYSALLQVLLLARVGPELATADAYATAAFAMGAVSGPSWTACLQGYEAMTVLADETVLTTGGFPDE